MEIQNLLGKGAITQIPLSKDGYYSRIFLVPKKGGGMRPVIDLSSLNNFVESQHRESNKNLDTLPPNVDSRDGISLVACATSWAAEVSPPSHLESSSTFSPPASTINSGHAETQPPIQHLHPPNTGFQNGINMVADKPAASKWQPNGANTFRYNNIHRCFKKGLGCDLEQCQNERKMVFSRGPVTYKSFGIERGIISGAISTEEPSPRDSQSEYGQLNGCVVYQSQGRNMLPGTHPDNTRTLELVHTAGHLSGCTPCPRKSNVLADQESRLFQDDTD